MESELPDLSSIRNVGVIAHIDAGKTSVTERFLFYSGKTHRIGNIDYGNTVMDYLDEERKRGITITAAAASFEWQSRATGHLVHIIDTPGHIDFTAEVERSLRICDGAVVIFSGVEGVEAQSEKVWRQSARYRLPKVAFINKMDRVGADFHSVVADMREKFTELSIIPVQLPVEKDQTFAGIIDLPAMRMISFQGDDGGSVVAERIEDGELRAVAEDARERLVAAVAEHSEVVAELYLNEKEVLEATLLRELRAQVLANRICPVLCGSAKKNIGIQPLIDAICDFLPSPADAPPCETVAENDEKILITPETPAFCSLVFKLIAGESADLIYVRTYSGRLRVNDMLFNSRTRERYRIKRILRLFARNVEAIEEAGPGDIIGLIGPQHTVTGDTLCAVNRPVLLEKIDFPEPVITIAIEPKSIRDKERLAACLALLCREDPTLTTQENETGQLLLAGMGELHLEINTNRLHHEFNIQARFGKPRVAFRETLRTSVQVTGVFDRLMGEKQLYAEVDIEFSPDGELTGNQVVSMLRGRNLPRGWSVAAVETLGNALKTGGCHGYPIIRTRAEIKDIRGTNEKTTDSAVAAAVMQAVDEAIRRGTTVLEPLMRLDITSPEENIGEITGYLQARRAVIVRMTASGGVKHLVCNVPMAEMFGFSKALPQLSGGRAGFSMEPCGYQPVSEAQLQRMIESSAAF